LIEDDAATADLGQDRLCGCGPDERRGVAVVGVEVVLDRGDQVGDRVKDAAADGFVGELAEEAFDEVQPRARGRGEVQVEARVLCLDLAASVGSGSACSKRFVLRGGALGAVIGV
jgi:hypothetical protein